MSHHRCELAEALLYSPVADALTDNEAGTLEWLLGLSAERALDPRELLPRDAVCWPTAVTPAGLPASIAAWAWPRYNRQGAVSLDKQLLSVDAVAAQALSMLRGQQAVVGRTGYALVSRRAGHIHHVQRIAPTREELLEGRLAAVWLGRVQTLADVRGAILGPLDAWPT